MKNYLVPGDRVKVLIGEKEVDTGKILGANVNNGNHFVKFQSCNPDIDGPLEFISFSGFNSADTGWFYIFEDPFDPFKKCYSKRGPIYHFKKA